MSHVSMHRAKRCANASVTECSQPSDWADWLIGVSTQHINKKYLR
ncbi:hypothetical protein PAMC26577_11850 [Caballeronia sordidicola]|uniref:Uncharacterized protein n=1 Tax=Caballeronia sordidicola TaxID=196367 RepID=A0A242MXE6_CABSO|nr:hypothetical protein PAMC26577_11850 [Caballeronia sordidicola]